MPRPATNGKAAEAGAAYVAVAGAMPPSYWKVVGGGDGKGGIIVRTGQATSSPMAEGRLSTGALIKECSFVESAGRLAYELVDGTGPPTGWVSISVKDKPLVERVDFPEQLRQTGNSDGASNDESHFPRVYFDVPPAGQLQRGDYKEFADNYFKELLGGEIVGPLDKYKEARDSGVPLRELYRPTLAKPSTPGRRDYPDPGIESRREAAAKALPKVEKESQAFAAPPPFKKISKKELEEVAVQVKPGHMYGLDLPRNLGDVEKWGAEWLTKAFHAAGSIPYDNVVKRVVQFKRLPTETSLAAGGAGPKAFLTVEYEKPDDSLHTELFLKMPWATTGTRAEGGDLDWRLKISSGDSELQECTLYRFLGPIFPFKIPKYYFGDINRDTTNCILITEKVLYGGTAEYFGNQGKTAFKAHEVIPVTEKYFDFKLEPKLRYEIYFCIMRAQARLAAWDHLGKLDAAPAGAKGSKPLGRQLGEVEWPVKVKKAKRDASSRMMETMIGFYHAFVRDKAKKAFADFQDPSFWEAVDNTIRDAGRYTANQDHAAYFAQFPHMSGLQHLNLQGDNAFFWRNELGDLDGGVIDWGGATQSSFVMAMQWSLTASEGEILHEYDTRFLQCFRDEYYKECSIDIDICEFERQWHLVYCSWIISCSSNIQGQIYSEVPEEQWPAITSLSDARVLDNWNCRCQSLKIQAMLRYLLLRWKAGGSKRLHVHDTLLEWRDYWIEKGME